MDALDLRIVRRLTFRPFLAHDAKRGRQGVWDVARDFDLHGSTVKRRLEALREADIVHGFFLIPAPTLLGVKAELHRLKFDDAETKRNALGLFDRHAFSAHGWGCTDAAEFVGDEAWVGLCAPIGADHGRFVERILAETGARSHSLVAYDEWGPDPAEVTPLDRRLLAALVEDALRPLADVAAEVGVTAKTARTRLRRLEKMAAFEVVAGIKPDNMAGAISFALVVTPEPGKEAEVSRNLLAEFPEAYDANPPRALQPFVILATDTVAEMDAAIGRAQALPGVTRTESLLLQRRFCTAQTHEGRYPMVPIVLAGRPLPLPVAQEAARQEGHPALL